jgi:hypothetical protein
MRTSGEEFIQKVLGLDWAWISDESSHHSKWLKIMLAFLHRGQTHGSFGTVVE